MTIREGWKLRLLASAVWMVLLASSAMAQSYSFSVPKLEMQVEVQPDASARIVYDITFQNNASGLPIDVVDIGVPHDDYDLRTVTASINGHPLSKIRPSEYVKPGFEVHLEGQTISPLGSATLHVEFTMPDMVWQDTTNADLASLRITPTWFGSQYVTGTTDIKLAIHLPKTVQPDEVLYQNVPFKEKVRTRQGTSVVWQWPADRLTGPHLVGVSFPKRDLDRVVAMTRLELLMKWFGESPQARLMLGVVLLVLFGFLFFRFTGGTGISVFVVLSGAFALGFVFSPGFHLLMIPVVIGLISLNEWFLDRRRPGYMPPIAQVEGGGIKRGLTAPEAAVILELPLSRILGLVVFGMLKKGLLRQVVADPLQVEVDEALRIPNDRLLIREEDRAKFYREAGQAKGVVIHKYEQPFLYLIQGNPDRPLHQIDFTRPMKQLLQQAAARMKGFDLSDTQDYYRKIVRQATQQAASIGDIPLREKQIDRNFEWILMDDGYPPIFDYGRPYRPIWTRGETTTWTSGGPSAGPAPSPPSIPGRTTFSDVSASFAGWAENTMGGLATAISPAALSVPRPGGGVINLSGADRLTGEFFQALAESAAEGGSGGGGGGGCACACAGCACACACAGGGR
jgi:hypothetical protein